MDAKVKSVSFEMGNFLRHNKRPQNVVIVPAAKSIDTWMRDVTSSIQTAPETENLIEARIKLVDAQQQLEQRKLPEFLNSVKSAYDLLVVGGEQKVESEIEPHRRRSVKSLTTFR